MHGVLITFDCNIAIDELESTFTGYAQALQSQPGLISKTWISTDDGYGGFHVFTDPASADLYLGSELAAGLMASDGFENFEVRQFEILDELSALTGVSTARSGMGVDR